MPFLDGLLSSCLALNFHICSGASRGLGSALSFRSCIKREGSLEINHILRLSTLSLDDNQNALRFEDILAVLYQLTAKKLENGQASLTIDVIFTFSKHGSYGWLGGWLSGVRSNLTTPFLRQQSAVTQRAVGNSLMHIFFTCSC